MKFKQPIWLLTICIMISSCTSSNKLNKEEDLNFSSNYKTITPKINREYKYEKRLNKTHDDENSFSVVLIPDQQSYVDYKLQADTRFKYPVNQREIYYRQMDYVKNNSFKNNGDFVFAVFLGDFVAHESRYQKEWIWADEATSKLIDNIPYGFVPGNHDYDGVYSKDNWKSKQIIGWTTYSKYFGPSSKYFKNMDWFGGSTANGLNQWSIFSFKDFQILYIGLEIEPSDKRLAWAQKVIDEHPGIPTIVATHVYLTCNVEKDNISQGAYVTETLRPYTDSNSPIQIWEKFISKNNQIFMVLSGHAFKNDYGESLRIDINKYNQPVYSIMTDYQGRRHYLEWKKIKHNLEKIEECGDGWIRILDFDLKEKNIHVTTYNPEFEMYEVDKASDYNLPITWEWGGRYNDEN